MSCICVVGAEWFHSRESGIEVDDVCVSLIVCREGGNGIDGGFLTAGGPSKVDQDVVLNTFGAQCSEHADVSKVPL